MYLVLFSFAFSHSDQAPWFSFNFSSLVRPFTLHYHLATWKYRAPTHRPLALLQLLFFLMVV